LSYRSHDASKRKREAQSIPGVKGSGEGTLPQEYATGKVQEKTKGERKKRGDGPGEEKEKSEREKGRK